MIRHCSQTKQNKFVELHMFKGAAAAAPKCAFK